MTRQSLPPGRLFSLQRIVVTGPNGAGKTYLATALARRTSLPLHHADAFKLTTGWQRRPAAETRALLVAALAGDRWIVEGGPSLLRAGLLDRAELVIRLDPPVALRAWRLATRPLAWRGRTRPELPPGNPDSLLRQYRFALASLRAERAFRAALDSGLAGVEVIHLRSRAEVAALLG